ncbi:S41 family peptidase [Flavobacterium sp. M31R6]|uniref:S41 family peptidase n=1 Tax=Flavobacterium sp. M31R6 TaxID=2739062 RepID=UPI00156A5E2D|nr:S41 family peptidase [Flavobacterium sp. M31R6]QKJ62703.1 peptidase S41 [Flavobacterium sp. M31R6]
MKLKIFALLLVTSFNLHLIHSQNIDSPKLSESEIKNLSSLCKIWGFLKYYHPNVAKGSYNWDEHLLTILPKVKHANSKEELSKIYLDWIENLGTFKLCNSCDDISKKEYFDKNFDLSWTQNTDVFTDELTKKLKYIENNRFQGQNHYVSTVAPKIALMKSLGIIKITNEPNYKNFEFPEQNYRLLSLFRYWNIVEYFYPYKYLTDQKWDIVLREMIPKFKDAKNATEYQLAIKETAVKLDDTHTFTNTAITNDFFGRKYIPASFKIIDKKAIITEFLNDSLAKVDDLRIGDVIEKVDDKNVNDILQEKLKYIHGSNYNTKLRNSYWAIFNGFTDSLKISLNRNEIISEKIVHRYFFKDFKSKNEIKEKYKIVDGNIGYVNMAALIEIEDVEKMMSEMKSTKAIIIDMRASVSRPYPLAKRLFQTKKEFAKLTEPDLSYPGRFIWKKTDLISPIKNEYYPGKVIVLVNESTQSASEYYTMCLQKGDNVTTIGSQTAGADGNTNEIEFIGFKSLMSGLGVYYPDGTETQRKGVKIDIEVHPTIKGIQERKDEVLERALEFLKKKLN